MRRARLLTLGLLLALAGCGPRQRVVRVAVALPLTGDLGNEGQGLLRAVTLAVEQANEAKRFPFRVEAVGYDDRADPSEAANVANLIVSDARVVAVIGHYMSDCALEAAPIYAAASIPMVTPSATNPELTARQLSAAWRGPRVVFRMVPTDEVQGAYAASFAFRNLRRRRVAVMRDQTPYAKGLIAQFEKTFKLMGGKIASEDGISAGDKDFKALLSRIKAEQPDALYYAGTYIEAGLVVSQMRAVGMTKTTFLSGDGAHTPSLFQVAGDAADGAYLTTLGVPVEVLPADDGFVAAYRERWPGEDLKPYDPIGYEAAEIILDGLARSGPDRAKLVGALRATHRRGVLGTVSFDEKGDTLAKAVTMMRADAKDRTFKVAR